MSKLRKAQTKVQRKRNRSKKLFGSSHGVPRICVFRSNNNIHAQIIDDEAGATLVAASSLDKDLIKKIEQAGSKTEKSVIVGTALAERAQKKKIDKVVFDRNGFSYTGRVKALADAAREGGLKF